MTNRQRKLAGIAATVAFLGAYCLAAMALGGAYIVGTSTLAEVGYFLVAGLAWLPVVMLIIRWMSRPDRV
jgi:hypothetical protein